jgi:hypothetical protein
VACGIKPTVIPLKLVPRWGCLRFNQILLLKKWSPCPPDTAPCRRRKRWLYARLQFLRMGLERVCPCPLPPVLPPEPQARALHHPEIRMALNMFQSPMVLRRREASSKLLDGDFRLNAPIRIIEMKRDMLYPFQGSETTVPIP